MVDREVPQRERPSMVTECAKHILRPSRAFLSEGTPDLAPIANAFVTLEHSNLDAPPKKHEKCQISDQKNLEKIELLREISISRKTKKKSLRTFP